MAKSSSDFILDEGLDDDEEVLAFHSKRQSAMTPVPAEQTPSDPSTAPSPIPAPSPIASRITEPSLEDPSFPFAPTTPQCPPTTPPTNIVIIDGMPLNSSRADLDAFLSGTGTITHLQVRRLDNHGIMRARVTFVDTTAARLALERDGHQFGAGAPCVSIKVDSDERWQHGCDIAPIKKQPDAGFMEKLPARETVTASFWAAFGAAKRAAENLEQGAKRIGEELEAKLGVSDKLDGAAEALEKVDKQYHVSERVGEMAAAGKSAAGNLDETYGISKGVGRIVGEVSRGARIVAREVDENLQLSDKAREATNMALKHDAIGPAVRTVVDTVARGEQEESVAGTPRKRKNYKPNGIEQYREGEALPELGE
eukprot:GFKZ01003502.1.p1 GENE.GFKZ01003502.1~~GFKZ01003502.1.p1  ORF type:complete len:368 (+),score=66.97 GFKZ01003502.1:357-1460(+)